MKIILYFILALTPSLVWLAFYLRKDKHPEPTKLIIRVFFLGVLAVPLAGLLENGVFLGLNALSLYQRIGLVVISFAFIEELLKYLAVRFGILKNPEFDEPVDAMIYLIIVALGFAAAENIWLLLNIGHPANIPLSSTLLFVTGRFLGATLLHALASAILGYFLAASLIITKSSLRKILVIGGVAGATILHSVFNYLIILNEGGGINDSERIFYLFILLLGGGLIVSVMFKRIKNYRAIYK